MTHFTKQDLILGRQCQKAVWLSKQRPDLAAQYDETALFRFKQGNEVDVKAREIFSGGALIDEIAWTEARSTTDRLVASGATRLYQPAFDHAGIQIRVDILDVHPDRSVTLREVKMSTRPKEEHTLDVATQVFVLESAGYRVDRALLVLINNQHTHSNGIGLFHEADITEQARAVARQMAPELDTLTETSTLDQAPEVQVGKHCTRPWTCSFYDHCWEGLPERTILSIPRLSADKTSLLLDQDILALEDVPADFPLTEKQQFYVQFHTTGSPSFNAKRIRETLGTFSYPLYFLDFETHSAPIPPYPGTRPYQSIPFQFSLHRLSEDGTLIHREYLHVTDTDPRPAVIAHLVEFIDEAGTILAYNASFEKMVLTDLADTSPEHAPRLQGMVDRLVDQLPLVKKNVQHPDLNGSYSLKTVTRVLLPEDITYEGLPIANGESAMASWVKMHELESEEEKLEIISALRAYCLQDTLAQVALHRWCEALTHD